MHTLVGLALVLSLNTVADDRIAVARVLDEFHDAASKADEARYFGQMTPDAVFIGTDAGERWTVEKFREYAHPHFAAGRGWTYVPRDRNIIVRGDVAWFDELLDNKKYGVCRGTGVLTRVAGAWKIAQYSLSIPIPNEKAAEIVKKIRE